KMLIMLLYSLLALATGGIPTTARHKVEVHLNECELGINYQYDPCYCMHSRQLVLFGKSCTNGDQKEYEICTFGKQSNASCF
ncbi:hypothetical protein PMAYCL1PPCAC_32926, partial [Pristionchus mayeri]